MDDLRLQPLSHIYIYIHGCSVACGCRPRLELLSAGLPLSLRVDAVGSGARPELASRWCAPNPNPNPDPNPIP